LGDVARYLDLTLSQLMQTMPGNSQLRCCLYYMLPGHGYRGLCPLSAPNRPTRETRGA